MIAFFFMFVAKLFDEVGIAIGKREYQNHKESIYSMGFLNLLWGALFFIIIGIFVRKEFVFALASLPTFGLRLLLEFAQAHFSFLAIAKASRSTYSFVRIITIPLILGADIVLGYQIAAGQVIGIILIAVALVLLLLNHGFSKKGAGVALFTAVNAVATISLFKYNITHFNSVEAEQGLTFIFVMIYFYIMARVVAKERPLRMIRKPIFFLQSITSGVGSVLISFTFLFAPASIITTIKRALSVLLSVVSGNVYFHEKKLALKLIAFGLVAIGLILLVI